MPTHLVTRLIYMQRVGVLGKALRAVLRFNGIDVPPAVLIGRNIQFPHCAAGVVIDERTRLHDNVQIFQHVTIGRARIWEVAYNDFMGITVECDAVLCAGAVVVTNSSLVVARGTVLAANSVLTSSTRPYEVWAGSPAVSVGKRAQ